jgi:protease I
MDKGKKILLLVGDYSEDYEVMCPYVTLRAHGHEVHVASPGKAAGDTIRTSLHEFDVPGELNYSEKPGHLFKLNKSFDEVDGEDYDGVFCAGGRGAEYIRTDERVRNLIQYFDKSGKVMGSICNGLQVYTEADVVNGRACVGYPDHRRDAIRAGAKWPEDVVVVKGETEDRAIVDGNFVSGATFACLSSVLGEYLKLLERRNA